MSLLIVGSIALDTIETPFGKVSEELGGAAVYSSLAATLFTSCALVGVVGHDFPSKNLALLKQRSIDVRGLQKQAGETFRWHGVYDYNLNSPQTKKTSLGVFENFTPTTFKHFDQFPLVFLANIDPDLQLLVIEKTARAIPFLAMDTMNYWIEHKYETLSKVIAKVDLVLMNEAEIRQYTNQYNLITAARMIVKQGPRFVIVKQGEYGCILFSAEEIFNTPSFLLEKLRDPTGAGDSFAGGVLGYLSNYLSTLEKYEQQPNFREVFSFTTMKAAVLQGNILASFTVEDFGPRRLLALTHDELDERYKEFEKLTKY